MAATNSVVDIDINLDEIDSLGDRRDTYRRLRQEAPIAKTRVGGKEAYLVTRYRDIEALLRDPRVKVTPAPEAFPDYLGDGLAADFFRRAVSSLDNDAHARLRKVVAPCLGPSATRRMSEWVGEIVDKSLDRAERIGKLDFVPLIAFDIPVAVATRLLHLKREEAEAMIPHLLDFVQIVTYVPLSDAMRMASERAVEQYLAQFNALIERSGDLPADDLVGAVVAAIRDGAMEQRDGAMLLMTVFAASIHTSMATLTNMVETLHGHPEARAQLTRDPSLAARAWEEVLRFQPPGHFRHRFLHEPTQLSGVALEPGPMIMAAFASANWDETEFAEPDRFDLNRPTTKHLSFGGGAHMCVGAHLSRIEGQQFVPRFLARFPNFSLDGPPPPRDRNLTFPAPHSLPVVLR